MDLAEGRGHVGLAQVGQVVAGDDLLGDLGDLAQPPPGERVEDVLGERETFRLFFVDGARAISVRTLRTTS